MGDWQLAFMAPGPVDPSLVMVTVGKTSSPAWCGEGQWKLGVVETFLLALHEAGARVIVPSINVAVPVVSDCGGLPGLVRLTEVTKRAGPVIYPDSVPPTLADAATAIGRLALVPHEDGVFRHGRIPSTSAESSPHQPLGLAIVSAVLRKGTAIDPDVRDRPFRFVGRWNHSPFPRHEFADVWNLIQGGDREELTRMFRGKVVMLFSPGSQEPTVSTLWEHEVPVEFLHALFVNAVLTDGWVSSPPLVVAGMVTATVGILLAFFLLREISLLRVGVVM